MLSWMPIWTDEGVQEIKDKLKDKSTYLDPTGGFIRDSVTDIVNYTLLNATGVTD